MGEIILANAIQREKGYMYYVDGKGNVCRAMMKYFEKIKNKKSEEPASVPSTEPQPQPVEVKEEVKPEQPIKKSFFGSLMGK